MTADFEPCATWTGKLRHLKQLGSGSRGRTLCGQYGLSQAFITDEFPKFGKSVPTITELAECVKCTRHAGEPVTVTVVRFSGDQIQALRFLLDLVHYDDVAQRVRDALPRELLAELAEANR